MGRGGWRNRKKRGGRVGDEVVFPTLMAWVMEWARVKSIAGAPGGMNPTPILVDFSGPTIGRQQRMVERLCDLSRVVRYLSPYDERMLYAWVVGRKLRLPLGQLRKVRRECMRAAREESRRPGAMFRLSAVTRRGQPRNEYRMGDWGMKKVEVVEEREAA